MTATVCMGPGQDTQLHRPTSPMFCQSSATLMLEPTAFLKEEAAELKKPHSFTEFDHKRTVSSFKPRGLTVSALRPVLKTTDLRH